MSSYKGHLFGGVLFFIPFAFGLAAVYDFGKITPLQFTLQVAVLFGITLLFALWPDVDIKSKGQKIFYVLFLAVDLLLIAKGLWREAAFLGLFAMIPIVSRHRGWTHALWAVFVVPLPFLVIPMWMSGSYTMLGLPYYLAAVAGYLSHRMMDGIFFSKQ
ncbi:MAG: metal-dependent hydrolase [Rhizobacter sp.]|nr:metal-dependent hydrolase [Chlorobiales bacterium]